MFFEAGVTGAGFFLDAAFLDAALLFDFPTGLKPGRFFFTFFAKGTKETAAAGDDMANQQCRTDEIVSFALNIEHGTTCLALSVAKPHRKVQKIGTSKATRPIATAGTNDGHLGIAQINALLFLFDDSIPDSILLTYILARRQI